MFSSICSFEFLPNGGVHAKPNALDAIVGEVRVLSDYAYGVSGDAGGRIVDLYVQGPAAQLHAYLHAPGTAPLLQCGDP